MIIKKGVVVKKSGVKTVKVEVNEYRLHPKYKKQYRITKNFLVHDEAEKVNVGDKVEIQQSAPISKKKTWVIVNAK